MTDKAKDAAATKPAAAKPAKAEKPVVEETPSALVAKFKSHGQEYTILRVSRKAGDKLVAGKRYTLASSGGVITLTPQK
jgi:hypothetical protein